ncbi:PTS transporter subunit EIIB [Paludibacterium yongneupense]|uniref:PTS transporter subunit EIIB n=1 Tax=Paludibacterium yongneupense TaxID=400061 RepID=UPI0003FFACE7|nr:PTS transporter subunit EIIB [Paludibacterium yongneupense]
MSNSNQGGLLGSLIRFLTGKPAAAAPAPVAAPVAAPAAAPAPAKASVAIDRAAWLLALGGADNVKSVAAVAGTRLRIELGDAARVDAAALKAAGAAGVMTVASHVIHVVAGADAPAYAVALN